MDLTMDLSIIVGLVGAVSTLVSPVIALLVKEKRANRLLLAITSSRRKAIEGNWKLIFKMEIKGKDVPEEFSGTLTFEAGKKVVKGKIANDHFKRGLSVLQLKGDFIMRDFSNWNMRIKSLALFNLT